MEDERKLNEKSKLFEKMLAGRDEGIPLKGQKKSTPPCYFDYPKEYMEMKQQFEALGELNPKSIYFNECEGINGRLVTINGKTMINFSSYNYLGMSGNPAVSEAAKEAIDQYGTSVSASRLASGERPIHRELENEISKLLGTEDSIVFIGGYITNESIIGHICSKEDLVVCDSLSHSSIQNGIRLSGAEVKIFPHNHAEALNRILNEHRFHYKRVLIVIEGIYSMDGDIADLPGFIEVKKRHKALLMVDEAHSIGVIGENGAGIGEHFHIDRNDVDIWMGTLSKSFASCGGYVSGSTELMEYLRFTTPGFVFSVGMPPSNAAAALSAIRWMKKDKRRLATLHDRANFFRFQASKRGISTGMSNGSAIIPVIIGDSLACLRIYQELCNRGIYVLPMIYPAVAENSARLRFFLSCMHTEEDIRAAVHTLAELLQDGSCKDV